MKSKIEEAYNCLNCGDMRISFMVYECVKCGSSNLQLFTVKALKRVVIQK